MHIEKDLAAVWIKKRGIKLGSRAEMGLSKLKGTSLISILFRGLECFYLPNM